MNRIHFCAWMFGAGVLAIAACRSDSDDPTPGNTPRQGSGGSSGAGGSSTAGSGTGGSGTGGSGTGGSSTAGSGTGGAGGADDAIVATLDQINNPAHPNKVPLNARVRVNGLVATSKKFLVSQSKSSGACLWGFFATTAGATTQEYGSIQVIAAGDNATSTGLGGAGGAGEAVSCPTAPEKAGPLPNDVKPGDLVDVVGYVDIFKLTNCGMGTNPVLSTGQRQIENAQATIVGTGAVPAPKEFSAQADLDALGNSTVVADVFDKWGGGLVHVTGSFTIDPDKFPTNPPAGTANCAAPFGDLIFDQTTLAANNNIYFNDLSEGGPKDSANKRLPHDKNTTFTSLTGIYAVDFCTWAISVRGKAVEDIAPAAVNNCFVAPTPLAFALSSHPARAPREPPLETPLASKARW